MLPYLDEFLLDYADFIDGSDGKGKSPHKAKRLLAEKAPKKAFDETVIDTFKKADPAVVNDLEFCKGYNTKNTCCTNDFVKNI